MNLPTSSLDFQRLMPAEIPRQVVFRLEDYMVWCASMLRTSDGTCHLWFSRWPKSFRHSAWVTHSEIAYATADQPQGPYRFHRVALPARGDFWDGHMTHNPHVIEHGGKFYLYYTGTRGPSSWRPDAPEPTDSIRWRYRMNQRVGVAVAEHPAGPWQRFDRPLLEVGAEYGDGLTATPCVLRRPEGDFLLVYKSQAPGPGTYSVEGSRGGGVFHYPALAAHPLGPFIRHPLPLVDKRAAFRRHFDYHIDDHVEWYQNDRYYAIVKDHDAPFLTPLGKMLYLMESPDGLTWQPSAHLLVSDFTLRWDNGTTWQFERLEMPKIHLEGGRPHTLFLAALPRDDPQEHSFNIAIPLGPATNPA